MKVKNFLIIGTFLPILSAPAEPQDENPDFLFKAPKGSVSLRIGYRNPRASSDIYNFFYENLTVNETDFNSMNLGLNIAYAVHPRIDILAGFDYSKPNITSEYREFVEDNDSPITQKTILDTTPVTASVKFYLLPRGRSVSNFSYVTNKTRPYIGIGGGLIRHNLFQTGDFVDFNDLSIFTSEFISQSWGMETHAFGGMDIQLTRKVFVTIEGRYSWADTSLSDDFVGFNPIDLSGFATTIGIGVIF